MKKKRKYGSSSIRINHRGGYVYQTYTYLGSENGKKKLVAKYIGKVSKTVLEKTSKDWDTYFDEIDYASKNKNPFTKLPQPISKIVNEWVALNEKQFKLNEISASTLRIHKDNVLKFMRWYLNEYSDKQIQSLTTKEINHYREYRIGLQLSPNTVSLNLRPIRTFLKWALKEKYIEYNPFTEDVKIPKYKRRKDEDITMLSDSPKVKGAASFFNIV